MEATWMIQVETGALRRKGGAALYASIGMLTMIRFRCYYCRRVHTVDDSLSGKRGRCVCGKLMQVPPRGAADGVDADGELPLALPQAEPSREEPGGVSGAAAQELQLGGARLETPTQVREEKTAAPADVPKAPMENRPPVRRKRRSTLFGGFLIVLSVPVFAAWIYQNWLSEGEYKLPGGPSYFNLPRMFWSTAVFSLGLGILLEGIYKRKGR